MSTRRPGRTRPNPTDPRYVGLPFGDGKTRRFSLDAPTEAAARLADGFLAERGWHVHRIGRARSARGPNGMRWAYRWVIAEPAESGDPG